MAEYSTFPAMHHFLESIPFPLGQPWHQVITEHPSLWHLSWGLIFSAVCGLVQILCWALTKSFAPSMMGYSPTMPLPQNGKNHKLHYQTLMKLTKNHDIDQYDALTISETCCNGELSDVDVRKFLESARRHCQIVEQNETRFSEALFPLFTKGFTLGFAILAFYDEDWLYDRALFFKGWPYRQGLDCCAADIKLLYMMHLGWYIYKLFAHAFIDRQLKDATANLIHHFCAISLIAVSYYACVVRAGVALLLLHDPADFLFQISKFCRLIHQDFLLNLCFGSVLLVWPITRMILFPYHIIGAGYFDFYEQHGPGWPFMMATIMFMCILTILHFYWYNLLVRAAIRAWTGAKRIKDSRSDDDAE